jgi:hypothetical protein
MVGLSSLWMPILLSAVLVFVVSSIIHMATPWHSNDYQRVPDEGRLLDALRPLALPPGSYAAPRPSSYAEMSLPAWAEKVKKGPNVTLQVMRNEPTSMTRNLVLWFLYSIVVGVFAGYVTGRAVGPGASYLVVFRFAGTTAFLAYAVALWQMTIWYQRPWIVTIKITIDGLIYALMTAGAFGWLWPR